MQNTLIMLAWVGAIAPEYHDVLFWGSIGFVMVLLLGFALLWFRRKYHPDGMVGGDDSVSFSMKSIEEMRAAGAISDGEFRRLRASSLGLAPPADDNDNSTLSAPADVDDGVEELDPSDKPQEDYKENT
ncbi:MAG: hypothetical protein QGG42_00960 [Phycisphaerae bacterium]|jgi:hypothetical protein|nr:hypothetical protein [Phycisphaerae bacterium]